MANICGYGKILETFVIQKQNFYSSIIMAHGTNIYGTIMAQLWHNYGTNNYHDIIK